MVSAKVDPDSCMEITGIRVEKREVRVGLDTQCEKLRDFAEEIEKLDFISDVLPEFCESRIYRGATKAKLHSSCCVPPVVVRAVEVEIGAETPRRMLVEFEE